MDKLLEVKNLKTYFYQDEQVVRAVDGVSFELEKNSILGVVGESGCGKTMSALSITKLLPKQTCKIVEGQIIFNKENLTDLSQDQLRQYRGRDIAYIFQEPSTSLNPVMTIKEQMIEIVQIHRTDIEREKQVEFLVNRLEEVGISIPEDKLNFFPHQMSGGEKQRVMIAMAIISRPVLLIADEPTTALDVTIQAQIIELLKKLKKEYGLAILFISHDLNVVASLADSIAVMYAGQIVEMTSSGQLIKNPKHPYTQGLFACLPENYTDKKKSIEAIAGEVPKADQMPNGCRFHPRCPKVFDRCKNEMPEIFKLSDNQEVRCWLYSD